MFKAVPHLMRVDQIEAGKAGDIKALAGKGGTLEKPAFKPLGRGFLSHQPDRARVRRHGGMFAAGVGADADGSGVSVTDG